MFKLFSAKRKKDPCEVIERLLGQRGSVIETVDNFSGSGLIKVKGQLWAARSIDGSIIDKDSDVLVVAREGAKLVCKIRKF